MSASQCFGKRKVAWSMALILALATGSLPAPTTGAQRPRLPGSRRPPAATTPVSGDAISVPARQRTLQDDWARFDRLMEVSASFDFDETPLEQCLSELSGRYQVPLSIDWEAIAEAGIGRDTPVSGQLRETTLRLAFRVLFSRLGLFWTYLDAALVVTSQDEAARWLSLRVYPIGDLVDGLGPGSDSESLVELITHIEPTSWDEVGGIGSVRVFGPNVVIEQNAETHWEVQRLLTELRRLKSPSGPRSSMSNAPTTSPAAGDWRDWSRTPLERGAAPAGSTPPVPQAHLRSRADR